MSFVVKKRDLTDPAQLQALIVEHVDDLERGLTILDSRLLLGQASIDIVGLDADGALVLIAVGLVADEEMFMKAVDAYSWCLEYPDAIHRLYPTVQFSAAQPPRVMFVVERMPDAFHRKVKQLGFPEVDCVEFRYLEVDGTPAMYFDSLARLRRGVLPTAAAPEQNGTSAAPVASGRPTSLKLQKLLGADRPAAGREPAAVVRIVHRTTPRSEPKPVATEGRTERTATPKRSEEPVTVSSRSTVDTPAAPLVRTASPKRDRTPSAPADVAPVAGVTEAIAGAPELLGAGVDAVMEPFVVAERPPRNGPVEPLPKTAREPKLAKAPQLFRPLPEPFTPEPVVTAVAEAPALEVDLVAAAISAPEPPPGAPAVLELESRASIIDATSAPAAVVAEPLVVDPEPEVASLSVEPLELVVPEPEPAVAELSVEALQLVTEPEPAPLQFVTEPEPAPLQLVTEPEPVVPPLSVEPLELVAEPEPVAPQLSVEPLQLVTEREPAVAERSVESLEPIEPAAPAAAAPSVFSRRAPDTSRSTRAELKVSFAGMAKDLIADRTPSPAIEPPVSMPRSSVEEITRAALDELVGATDKRATEDRSTAFAKPAGAFSKAPAQKRPRTIAAPTTEGQPIAGTPKLGAGPRRVAGTDPAPPTVDGETTQAVPEGFEGLQFPNDGVLTRQWMEFLNQMAAGK